MGAGTFSAARRGLRTAAVIAAALLCGCVAQQQQNGTPASFLREAPTAPRLPGGFSSPEGAPKFFSESFEDPCLECRGWYDNVEVVLTANQKAVGNKSVEYRFNAGASKPVKGDATRRLFPPSNSVYVSYRVKYSEGWVGSRKDYHPHEFMVLSNMDDIYAGPSHTWMTLYVEQNYNDGGRPRLVIQDSKSINAMLGALPRDLTGVTNDRSVSGCNGPVEQGFTSECYNAPPWTNNKQLRGPAVFRPTPGPGYIGDWNLVEAYFQLNTIRNGAAVPDGVMQYWFNGKIVLDRHDVVFRMPVRENLRLNQFIIAPYLGDGSPITQTMWVDDVIVALRRPEFR